MKEEILIAGAGPAGAATSLFLSKKKIPHVIIDKAKFPRDKICGDALSGKVVHILNKLDKSFVKEFEDLEKEFTGSYGICFYAPNGKKLEVPFSSDPQKLKNAPGFISRRMNFDKFLFDKLDRNYANIHTETELTKIEKTDLGIAATLKSNGKTQQKEFRLVVGAEGDRSVVANQLTAKKINPQYYCAALRAYFTGVTGFHESKFIELHFMKDILPGYFWIFPMNDGSANVGIGLLSSEVSEKKLNLKKKMLEIITMHPVIRNRFTNATMQSEMQGWGLPLGSLRRKLSGNNFILAGDAGSLIDPFTGEGIGNALYSGMHAAEIAARATTEKKFDERFLASYDEMIYNGLKDELRLSYGIQKLAKKAWLFNFVVGKAIKNKMLRETITCMFDDIDIRARLRKPSFYLKLLIN